MGNIRSRIERTGSRASEPLSALIPFALVAGFLGPVAGILHDQACSLLLVDAETGPSDDGYALYGIARDGRCRALSGLGAKRSLRRNASAIAAHLAEAWPDYARPDRIGFVTDGTGIGFSPDKVSVGGQAWLSAVLAGHARFAILAPFDASGGWARISAPPASTLLH